MKPFVIVSLVCLLPGSTTLAAVSLPAIISDHMVLQAGVNAPIWGRAEPGEAVTVKFANQTKTARADATGKWTVQLEPLAATAESRTLTVAGQNTLTIQDVIVGEVWLGSGQSNMALPINAVKDADAEIAAARDPLLRMFKENSEPAAVPQAVGKGVWTLTTPEVARNYAAALYFFGRELHQTLRVPVGLINSSVGGTPIESWISAEAQERSPELHALFAEQTKTARAFDVAAAKAKYARDRAAWETATAAAKAAGKPLPKAPTDSLAVRQKKGGIGELYNAKIVPLAPYALRGALWYQGEANSAPAKAVYYEQQLRLLISDWRARWGNDFYFAAVQLPNFEGGAIRDWPMMREAIMRTLQVPKTGMAITIDVGDADNIHAKNKQAVGHRLAAWALGTVYGQNVATSGPLPAGHEVRDREIFVRFDHVDGGLVAHGGKLTEFLVAGTDRQWKTGHARIEGDGVLVSSPEVSHPVAVRYAWKNNPQSTLYNGAGLPASPFRTDDWK